VKIKVSKSFDTRVEKSERVLEVAEAFGLGLTDKKFVVYEGLEMEINPGDVVYVNGQSGSGKSLLLRDMSEQFSAAGMRVYDIADVPLLDLPLVDQIGSTTEEALQLLSQAGLNDAYLFIRKPCELSDGQKYRFKLAKLIESGAEVWIADEFAAVLDRDTAKVVAHNVAKTARSASAILLVATTHTDLRAYLGASVTVEKLYGTRVEIKRLAWTLDGERIELPPEPIKPEKPKAPRKQKAAPMYIADPDNPEGVIRCWRNKRDRGTMIDGKFKKTKVKKDGRVASNDSKPD
jgi:ABC-type ATPase with predicted acetyltransferase domain